jgi:hypothetical protein
LTDRNQTDSVCSKYECCKRWKLSEKYPKRKPRYTKIGTFLCTCRAYVELYPLVEAETYNARP